jgi:DNA-binding NarL/FixJ family response regulator
MSRRRIILFTPRLLLAELLGRSGIADVHVAPTGREAIRLAQRTRAHLCIVDAANPTEDAFAVAARLGRMGIRIIVLADSVPAGWIQRSVEAGAASYLGKCATLEDLARAIRAELHGQAFQSPCATRRVWERTAPTGRQLQVLRLLCDGLSSKQIAHELGLSPKTVDSYRAALMEMAGVRNTPALVRFACNERYVDLRPAGEPKPGATHVPVRDR